jgi:hypothetical protein
MQHWGGLIEDRKNLLNSQIDVSSFQKKKFNMVNIRSWWYGREVHISKFLHSIIALKLHFVPDIPFFQSHDLGALDRL